MAHKSFCTRGAVLQGIEAVPVVVEVSVSQQVPGMTIVGMPDTAVSEAKHRVRCACKGSGFEWPLLHFTVNLSPSELRKSGSGLDLPIAVAVLACTGQIPTKGLDDCIFVGELGLKGNVSGVRGLVAYDILAEQQGLKLVASAHSHGGKGEALMLEHLSQLKQGVRELPSCGSMRALAANDASESAGSRLDFAEVVDQDLAKRACVIAAAGNHGLLMVGPPGAGKSMLAKRMPTILPPLDDKERAESLLIHSVAGQDLDSLNAGVRPFRAPHHTITEGGMVGGGRPVRPGEASLAHNGVLFLDELPEFGPRVLQSLRQPLEDHEMRLVRVEGVYTFPCKFMLVAAANPCPCGYLGDPDHVCTCSTARINAYQSRIGGPLMDRIDVLVDVARPSSARIIEGGKGTSSSQMASEVIQAREFASWRRAQDDEDKPDYARSVPELHLNRPAQASLEGLAGRLGLGGRNIVRIARVARTVADLEESKEVKEDHVMEACAFRTRATL